MLIVQCVSVWHDPKDISVWVRPLTRGRAASHPLPGRLITLCKFDFQKVTVRGGGMADEEMWEEEGHKLGISNLPHWLRHRTRGSVLLLCRVIPSNLAIN